MTTFLRTWVLILGVAVEFGYHGPTSSTVVCSQ